MLFKQRLIDGFVKKWRGNSESNNVLLILKHEKSEFSYEDYLTYIKDKKLSQILTKLRLSSQALKIETGRYGRNRLDRQERLCIFVIKEI